MAAANAYPVGKRGGSIVQQMLTIPESIINPLMKVPHNSGTNSLTSIMRRLQRDLYKSGVVNTREIQRDLAYKGLVQAGMEPDMARIWRAL